MAVVALHTLLRREVIRFSRIWIQTLIPPTITMALYFVVFGNLIGSRIGEMGGFSYIQYIVPGLIMMAIITNTYTNVVSSFFSAKFQRHIEELLASPTPNYVILLGFVGGGMARGLMVGCLVTLVAFAFTPLELAHLEITVLVALLTSALFACAGLINGVFARTFDDTSIVPTFVLTPLTYLGGVFFSIDLLPEFWQGVSLLNPILYMVNAFRFGILGVTDIDVSVALGIIGLFVVVLFSFALWLLHKGIGLRS
ncbi:MAG: ABC transporter permease [Candidatus Competibacterales bacterium]